MKSLIQKLKCVAAIAVASAVFGFSTERSEAASSATMVFTVDAGVVTHISITDPFGFYPNGGNTYGMVGLVLQDAYSGDAEHSMASATEVPAGMFSLAGSGVSIEGLTIYKTDMGLGAETDAEFTLHFQFDGGRNFTSEDFVEIFGGFAVDPSAGLVAPTAGMYSSALYDGEAFGEPFSNTIMVEVIVNSVPEPGSCLLGLMGVASLVVCRRR